MVVVTAALCAQLLGLVLTLAALGLERLLGIWHLRCRDVWALTLVASATTPAILVYCAFRDPNPLEWQLSTELSFSAGMVNPNELVNYIRKLVSDEMGTWVGGVWLASSIGFVGLQLWGLCRLGVSARRWKPCHVEGTSVLLSDDVGPGAIGVFRPKIVVPRWLITADPNIRIAALAHEREHVEKRDQLLVVLGLIVLSTMPWNFAPSFQFERLCLAIEVDCDERVVSSKILDRQTYAAALLALWKRTRERTSSLFIPRPSTRMNYRLGLLRGDGARVRMQ